MAGAVNIWNPDTGIAGLDQSATLLHSSELDGIAAAWKREQERLRASNLLAEFNARLNREWSIETGALERVYSIDRGVTVTLIERGFKADLLHHGSTDKPADYVIRVLKNQESVIEGVFDFIAKRRVLSVSYIKELHSALLEADSQVQAYDEVNKKFVMVPLIKGDWKKLPNSPMRDGILYHYCPPEHVASEMDRLIDLHERHAKAGMPADVAAAWMHHRFTQIHPFQDGNGRVVRALVSMVLIQAGLFPLIVQRDDSGYIPSLEAADEGDLRPLIALIVDSQRTQFIKASRIIEEGESVDAALDRFAETAKKKKSEIDRELRRVIVLAECLIGVTERRLREISKGIAHGLKQRYSEVSEIIMRSTEITSHYFRSQIIQNAKFHLKYLANTEDYAAWVSMNLEWSRRAKLVFAFHAIGRPFSGAIVCAPFLEYRDISNVDQASPQFSAIAKEPFTFFHNEDETALAARFMPWLNRILTAAIADLEANM